MEGVADCVMLLDCDWELVEDCERVFAWDILGVDELLGLEVRLGVWDCVSDWLRDCVADIVFVSLSLEVADMEGETVPLRVSV